MRRVLAVLVIGMMSMVTANADMAFITKITDSCGVKVVTGTLYGLNKAPIDNRYEVIISNAKGFKDAEFSIMDCKIFKGKAEPLLHKSKSSVRITTVYYEPTGDVATVTGYVAGMVAMAADGYGVYVKTKNPDQEWNLLKCTISN